MKKRMIRVNGTLYEYTDILAQKGDAYVIDVDVDSGNETPVEKRFVEHEMPDSTDTPARPAKTRVPAPNVTVTRGHEGGLGPAADAALKQG